MADKKHITDRYLRSLQPAPAGKPIEVWDTVVPGFGIKITDVEDAAPARRGKAGRIFFLLYARFGAGALPTRRTIGVYGQISLEQARQTAGEWRSQIVKGIDPAVVEAEAREKEARERARRIKFSFANVAEDFVADKLKQERDGKDAERQLRTIFMAAWAAKPISEITEHDVLEVIRRKKRHAPQMARALLVLVRRFFNWVCDQRTYGLDRSPCDRIKPKSIIGAVPKRNRRLTNDELIAFWRATERMRYPAGPVYRLLLLTGLRLNEAAQLSWSEVQGDIIVIPPERMKAKDEAAVEHLVPLSSSAQEVIASLPRIRGGKFLFSLSGGKRPLAMTGPIKNDLDRRMLRTLKALARHRGEDHDAVELPHWTNHDLRRTVRSGLSALRVPHNVAEAVLAHRQGGIVGIYDLHEYRDEKAEALEAWAQRIASIVSPVPAAPAKVIKLRGAAMIEIEFPTYTDAQWNEIKAVFRDELSLDADRIERQVTIHNSGPEVGQSFTGMEPLRQRIESTMRQYHLHSEVSRLSPRREALNELRESAENLRDSILGTVAVPFRAKTQYDFPYHPLLLDGVDGDMLTDTRDYFRKLLANLDRMIDRAGSRQRGNARKSARDTIWNELLEIWCEFCGEETGEAAARFLFTASVPMMNSAVPDIRSIVRWLKRRQSKPAMNKPVLRLGRR